MTILSAILSTLFVFVSASRSMPRACAFLVPTPAMTGRPFSSQPPQLARRSHFDGSGSVVVASERRDAPQRRREFLLRHLGAPTIIVASSATPARPPAAHADQDVTPGDLTSQLFNADGSLRDQDAIVEAQERAVRVLLSVPVAPGGLRIDVATDGAPPPPPATAVPARALTASYKLPVKWNQNTTSARPLYYDSSEGKNGRSCDRITLYAVSNSGNIDASILEKAPRVGVAKSLFMNQIPNQYFDGGVSTADLISGRTVRKPVQSVNDAGEVEFDEQVYYEFDLAFAPEACPDFREGNKENLGLGFCPYDRIFLVSATVLPSGTPGKGGTLVCCVIECDKREWKLGNSDIKRVRASFTVDG